jgi:hypothetical protein
MLFQNALGSSFRKCLGVEITAFVSRSDPIA